MTNQKLLQHAQRNKARYWGAAFILGAVWLGLLAYVRGHQSVIDDVTSYQLGLYLLVPMALSLVMLVLCYGQWFGRPRSRIAYALMTSAYWLLVVGFLLMWLAIYYVFVLQLAS